MNKKYVHLLNKKYILKKLFKLGLNRFLHLYSCLRFLFRFIVLAYEVALAPKPHRVPVYFHVKFLRL